MKIELVHASVVLSALCLASCASGVSYETFESSLGPIPDKHGRVYFYRLENEGEALSTSIRASGLPIGRTVAGGFFYADLTAGTHLLTATRNADRSLAVMVTDGTTQYVRVGIVFKPARYLWELTVVPEDVALVEIARTTNTGR